MYEDFDFPGATIFTLYLDAYGDFIRDVPSSMLPAELLCRLNLSMDNYEQWFCLAFVVPDKNIQQVYLLKTLGKIPEFRMQ